MSLIEHVEWAITKAQNGDSKLNQKAADIAGMSSFKNRILLNRLLEFSGTKYLEIGV